MDDFPILVFKKLKTLLIVSELLTDEDFGSLIPFKDGFLNLIFFNFPKNI